VRGAVPRVRQLPGRGVGVVSPDIPTPVLVQVIAASGHRCQCVGACGRDHSTGRCIHRHVLRHGGRLVAAPADPAVPAHRAYRTPVEALAAWCGPCLDRARRRAAARPANTPTLFEIAEEA